MRSRLATLLAIALAVAAIAGAGTRVLKSSAPHRPAVHAVLTPKPFAYLGVFEAGAPPGYSPVEEFAKAARHQPNIVGYYSGWAEPFDTSFAETVNAHNAIPFVQIDPTDASVPAMAAGTYDEYLRSYADSVRDYGRAVIIGFGHEMNASGYSWGYGHLAPSTFVAAWRHLVTLFHGQGADNVTWVWTIEADHPDTGNISDWWPGAQYVTWVGVDGYYYVPSDTFATVFGRTINQVHALTNKPVLLSETAVGPEAGQYGKIQNLFTGMAASNLLGLVWFDKHQHGTTYHQDWRIEDNPYAESSFQLAVSEHLTPVTPNG